MYTLILNTTYGHDVETKLIACSTSKDKLEFLSEELTNEFEDRNKIYTCLDRQLDDTFKSLRVDRCRGIDESIMWAAKRKEINSQLSNITTFQLSEHGWSQYDEFEIIELKEI